MIYVMKKGHTESTLSHKNKFETLPKNHRSWNKPLFKGQGQ